MRMHEVTADQMIEWLAARYEAGREKYGDAHLHRYGLVDVIEEVLDAINILKLWAERMEAENIRPSLEDPEAYERLVDQVLDGFADVLFLIRDLDAHIPGRACSDEQGGHRVWWSEEG